MYRWNAFSAMFFLCRSIQCMYALKDHCVACMFTIKMLDHVIFTQIICYNKCNEWINDEDHIQTIVWRGPWMNKFQKCDHVYGVLGNDGGGLFDSYVSKQPKKKGQKCLQWLLE